MLVATAPSCDVGMFKLKLLLRGRRHRLTVHAATKNVAENAQKIKISKPLPWNATVEREREEKHTNLKLNLAKMNETQKGDVKT